MTVRSYEHSSRWLLALEKAGNRLPHPAVLFIGLCGFLLLVSALASGLGVSAQHPIDDTQIQAKSLLSSDGFRYIIEHTVSNFTGFAPVGTVLVAMLGIAIAERSGLIAVVLKAVVFKAPKQSLSFFVALAGVLSSLAADAGYVVLLPLAALVFQTAGRSPVLGIAVAFAGVSGGFSANLLIGPIDALLAGISTEAAHYIEKDYTVSAAGNYYFLFSSTLVIALICTWVTERFLAKTFDHPNATDDDTRALNAHRLSNREKNALLATIIFTLVFVGGLIATLMMDNSPLAGEGGSIINSPFLRSIVAIIAIYTALAGTIYGYVSGQFTRSQDLVDAMEGHMATMAGYLVLMFFAAQFINWFSWSQLGVISAIKSAEVLQALSLSKGPLLIGFVLLAAIINLVIGSASAKWALIAPIFVPMFMLLGISPEATQMAYRIGDSTTNIISPLMPYFGVVIAFVSQYKKDAGIGTLVALMLPYSIALLIGWTLVLGLWIGLDLPLGPGASISYQLPN